VTPNHLLISVLLSPAVVVIGLVRPQALLALVLLSAFAAAVARTGLWLLGERTAVAPELLALRVGFGVFAASVVVAVLLLLLGPASVPVLAFLAVAAAAVAATRIHPARPAF
jgi:hypothetical protein